jgi:hypothetical protein
MGARAALTACPAQLHQSEQLTQQVLIIGLLFGATFLVAGSGSRRLLGTRTASGGGISNIEQQIS